MRASWCLALASLLVVSCFSSDKDGDDENNFVPLPAFEFDYFQGSDRWYAAEYNPTSGWSLVVSDVVANAPQAAASAARLMIRDNTIVLAVPLSGLSAGQMLLTFRDGAGKQARSEIARTLLTALDRLGKRDRAHEAEQRKNTALALKAALAVMAVTDRDLAESIAANGILQPILVRPSPARDGMLEIVAGERRWHAARLAGR